MGEGKDDNEETGEVIDATPAGDNLVVKLVDYAFKYLHEGLSPFFEKHIDDFGEDWEVLMNEGESHEQYAIYQEYKKLMTTHLDKFSEEQGFSSFEDCFEEVQRLVAEDNDRAKKELEKLKLQMAQMEEETLKRREESLGGGEGKTNNDGDDETDDEGKAENDEKAKRPIAPQILFFSRLTLENMLHMVLNMCEYRSFSMMMRTRAAQRRWLKEIEKWNRERAEQLTIEDGSADAANGEGKSGEQEDSGEQKQSESARSSKK